MSDSITSFLSDVSQAAGFGAFTPVKLGQFGFGQYEVPETIAFGGKQKTTVHTRPGGQRQIDVLGPENRTISWSGIFLSADAAQRATQLDQMRITGTAVDLKWGQFSYRVVIESLELTYKRTNWVDYRIECIVVQPNVKKDQQTLLGSITKDLGSALGIDLPAGLAQVNDALKTISPLVGAVTTLTGGSTAAIGMLGAVNSAQGITSGLNSLANGNISGLTQITTTFTGNSKIIATLGALGGAVNAAPQLQSVSNYLGRMGNNLSNPAAS